MVTKTLLQPGAPEGAGPIANFPQSDNIRIFQFNPKKTGFSGSVTIESSFTDSPGNDDFQTAVTVNFSNHKTNFSLDVELSAPWIRARMVSSDNGSIAVYGSSKEGTVTGTGGTSSQSATATVSSAHTAGVTGQKVHLTSPTVPAITSDDVAWSEDPVNSTVTDEINDLKGKTDYNSSADDVDLLDGLSDGTACGGTSLTTDDFCKLTSNATIGDLNNTTGTTDNIQDQLDGKVDGAGVDLTGLTVSADDMNTFFDESPPTVTISELNASLTGLTASAGDLNTLTNTAGTFTAADLEKLGDITASASEVNSLSGFTGTSTDLNKLSGMTSTTADLNAIGGLAGTGVSTTELQYLSGLNENVQTALDNIPELTGLNASSADLNILEGASNGTAGYTGVISKSEINALDGVSSNVQDQLDAKRNSADCIGVGEICGASITITELNYLQGANSNIQAQIDNLTNTSITSSGGTFTGAIYIADGSAAAPGLGYSGSNTTGLYLEGAPGMGFTVSGVRSMSLDDNDLKVGDTGTNGQPLMRHASPNENNPTYSFVGDENTGMYWAGNDAIGFSVGGNRAVVIDSAPSGTDPNVELGGAESNNWSVGVSGVARFEKILGRATVQAGGSSGSTGNTPIYTVPTGRSAIVTKIMVVLENVTAWGGPVNPLRMNFGYTAPNYDQIVDNVNNTSIYDPSGYQWGTAGQALPLGYGDNAFPAIAGSSGADYGVISAAQTVQAYVSVVANANDWDMDVVVFGYEF